MRFSTSPSLCGGEVMRSDFEKAFKKEYPHADYLACLKFDEVENQYKPINEEVEPPDVNFWVCVGVNTGWWAWQYRQTELNDLQKRVDAAYMIISQLNALDDEAHKRWKREACMFSQGESNAYEHAVRLLERALKGGES